MATAARSTVGLVSGCMLAAAMGAWLVHANWLPPAVVPVTPPPAVAVASPSQFAAFLDFLKRDAAVQGITPVTFDTAFARMVPDPEVIELAGAQPEYVKSAGEYLGLLVSEARIETGRLKLAEQATTLAAVETAMPETPSCWVDTVPTVNAIVLLPLAPTCRVTALAAVETEPDRILIPLKSVSVPTVLISVRICWTSEFRFER